MRRCVVSIGYQDEFNGVAAKDAPTVWLPLMATMTAVLSERDQSLLRLIRDKHPKSLKMEFAAKQDAAVVSARPYWQRAENERKAAIALGKPILELERVIQATSNGQRTALQEQLRTLTTQKQTFEVAAKSARVGGDARCWPIFNLDLKNPNTKAGLEHPDPKDLITSMCSQKVEVMRPLVGIEALTAEV